MEDKVKKLTEELLKNMGFVGEVSVSLKDKILQVNIESEDSGLLIGNQGETLHALQLVVGLMLNNGSEEWQPVLMDIGGYRAQREDVLRRMVERAARRVKDSGEDEELPAMQSFERRTVHMFVAEYPEIVSESTGEGRHRQVIIKPA